MVFTWLQESIFRSKPMIFFCSAALPGGNVVEACASSWKLEKLRLNKEDNS
jgi:hypothetical protein